MIYIRDAKTKKKYPIKGITESQYNTGNYAETEMFDKIYQLLIKHDIQDGELINKKGERLD
jgi:hypothetical protein